jgi:D-glycero-D-manno-heptose 1,7-bisphosphate phosphatase
MRTPVSDSKFPCLNYSVYSASPFAMIVLMNSETRRRPAVFIDRDGTIIEDHGHLSRKDQVVFYPDSIPALLRLQQQFDLFIVTNQSGVAKGEISIDDVDRVNGYVVAHLSDAGIRIVETYVCPHDRADECICIKPKPFFLKKAEQDHGIDLTRSFVIGDHPHDVDFGTAVGAGAIYLLSGHGEKHRSELIGDEIVVEGIAGAADLILRQSCEARA